MPASTLPRRRSRQVAAVIRSTSRFSSSPSGCSSVLRRSLKSLRASSSSSGRRTCSERRPCFTALRRTAVLPSSVLGPVLFSAFCRLASAFLSLVIEFASSWFIGNVCKIVVHSKLLWHCLCCRALGECRSSYRIQSYCRKLGGRAAEELVVPLPSILGNLMMLKRNLFIVKRGSP